MTNNLVAIQIEGLSKKFCLDLKRALWYGVEDLGRELFLRGPRRPTLRRQEFWALSDISVKVHSGETLGIIGHNGAGKSTLLKLINGVIKPDKGRIETRGRVGALIELGMGFSPILTGRENILVNAAVLGIPHDDAKRLLPEIVDFAEIGDFIDTPVRVYSSGMKVRLGFSVASHMDPDILLVDEVLSVGDSSFRQRCYRYLRDFKRGGGTILFVSHNSSAVEAVCDQVMLLDHGKVVDLGEPWRVVQRYEEAMLELSRRAAEHSKDAGAAPAGGSIRITTVECRDMLGKPKSEFEFGEPFEIFLRYEANQRVSRAYFVIAIKKGGAMSPPICAMHMAWDNVSAEDIRPQGVVGCVVQNPPFAAGDYQLHVGVQSEITGQLGAKWHANPRDIGSFKVLPNEMRNRLPGALSSALVSGMPPVVVAHTWKINERTASTS